MLKFTLLSVQYGFKAMSILTCDKIEFMFLCNDFKAIFVSAKVL